MGTGPAVECRDLVVRYGTRTAVDGLGFEIAPGEVLALLGPNGAGKTSTVETLEGYRRPAAGAVRVLGLDPVADRRRVVPRIGVMLQRGGVYPTMGPRQALHLFARYYDDPRDPDELLSLLGLEAVARAPWRRLSGGEQQRLSLALALVGRPTVAFLDEPTAGVDPEGRLAIRRVVAELAAGGTAVLLTTHELAEAEKLADRIVILAEGRSLASGTLAELGRLADREPASAPGSVGGRSAAGTVVAAAVRFAAPPGIDRAGLAGALGIDPDDVTEPAPGEYAVAGAGTPVRVAAITAWLAQHDLPLADLRVGRRSLEEIYLSLTSGTPGGPR